MLISVVIPAYNEVNSLPLILKKLEEIPYDKEIIIVDDGSKDGTREWICSEFGVQNQVSLVQEGREGKQQTPGRYVTKMKVVFHGKNRGKGGAVGTGMQAATGDVVIIQDADLEYDPGDYPKLFEPITQGKADVVYGSRFLGGPHKVHYFWHYVNNKMITLVSNMFTNLNLSDMETCYKVFKKEVLQGITIESQRFGFEPEITAKMAKRGVRIYEVPIAYYGRSREEGKKITWKDGVKALFTIIKYNVLK
jgi:glycosyltransferase involved in cell wall biosynthesis